MKRRDSFLSQFYLSRFFRANSIEQTSAQENFGAPQLFSAGPSSEAESVSR